MPRTALQARGTGARGTARADDAMLAGMVHEMGNDRPVVLDVRSIRQARQQPVLLWRRNPR